MCHKIRYDKKSENFYKISHQLSKAYSISAPPTGDPTGDTGWID